MSQRDRTPFGARMFFARERRGLTQEAVCKRVGIAQSTLAGIEREANSTRKIAELADLYLVDPLWLATEAGTEPQGYQEFLSSGAIELVQAVGEDAAHYRVRPTSGDPTEELNAGLEWRRLAYAKFEAFPDDVVRDVVLGMFKLIDAQVFVRKRTAPESQNDRNQAT